MASATLQAYYDATLSETYSLVSSTANGSKWILPGQPIGCQKTIEIVRSLTPSGAMANDHVKVIMTNHGRNTTTGKIATSSISMDISIPKDQSILTETLMKQDLKELSSLLNDSRAGGATYNNALSLIRGTDI